MYSHQFIGFNRYGCNFNHTQSPYWNSNDCLFKSAYFFIQSWVACKLIHKPFDISLRLFIWCPLIPLRSPLTYIWWALTVVNHTKLEKVMCPNCGDMKCYITIRPIEATWPIGVGSYERHLRGIVLEFCWRFLSDHLFPDDKLWTSSMLCRYELTSSRKCWWKFCLDWTQSPWAHHEV